MFFQHLDLFFVEIVHLNADVLTTIQDITILPER